MPIEALATVGRLLLLRIMAKPETDFVEDDFAMARRAQWLLDDRVPSREQPPPDLDLNRFGAFVGAGGFLEPLAHFGQRRRDDAVLATKRSAAPVPALDAALPPGAPMARKRALSEACASEKRANDELREARAHIRNAKRHWLRASELRVDADDKIGVLALHGAAAVLVPTGEHQAILDHISSLERAVDGAVAALEPSLRRLIGGDPFPSTLGLRTAERNAALNEQAMNLLDGGVPLLAIAYVMGWYQGSKETIEAIQDKTSKRIALVRQQIQDGDD